MATWLPRQPEESSLFQQRSWRSGIPKESDKWCANVVSLMPYLRRVSSSGKRRRNTIAQVRGGRGLYCALSSAIQFWRTLSGRLDLDLLLGKEFAFRGRIPEISRSNETKLIGCYKWGGDRIKEDGTYNENGTAVDESLCSAIDVREKELYR